MITPTSHTHPTNRRPASLKRGRFWLHFWQAIFIILLTASPIFPFSFTPAQASTKITAGYKDFDYGLTAIATPTAEKPESKLWFNDGIWWGSLFNKTANAYQIYRFDAATQNWTTTGVRIDERPTSLADALWDDASLKLYIVSHLYSRTGSANTTTSTWGRLYRYSYNPSSDAYTLDGGYPVTVTKGKSETLTVAKDSTGMLWVTYVESNKVMINHSNGSDNTWVTPYPLPATAATNLASDDIASVIAFQGKIGVMWSNQNAKKIVFAVHTDGASDTTWLSSSAYTISADDHINLKQLQSDPAGNVFAVVKTSLTSATQPIIVLLACKTAPCTTSTNWSAYTAGTVADSLTRPILLIDTQHRDLYVFMTAPEGSGVIYYKKTSLDNISFVSGRGTPFIQSATDTQINNATSTKQNVSGASGLLVTASDEVSRYYFHNFLTLGGPLPPTISDFNPKSGPAGTEVTLTGSHFTGTTAVSFNNTPAASFIVDSDTQVRATVAAGTTSGPIKLTTLGGTVTSVTSFTVGIPPSNITFSPTSGPIGQEVTVSGVNFTGATSVSFNGVSTAPIPGSVTPTQLRANVPVGASSGPVSVTTPNGTGTSASSFTVTSPYIISFNPTSGNVGSEVTITGANLNGVTGVTFNGTAAVSFTAVSAAQVIATVPDGATSGPISVITASNGTAVSAASFTVTVPPVIASFSPSSGMAGQEVVISGSHLLGTSSVSFNGVSATPTSVQDGEVRVNVPSGATSGPISLTAPGGTAVTADLFIVTTPSTLSFTPTDDAQVKSDSPNSNYGNLTTFRMRSTGPTFNSYLKFNLTGISAAVQSAKLRLYVNDPSPVGGSIFSLSNNSWTEGTINWTNAPPISGSPLSTLGAVARYTTVEFDVSSAVKGNGILSFGMTTSVTDSVYYNSSESSYPPQLVVQLAPPQAPVINDFTPKSGSAGTPVTITGSNFTGAVQVSFNGTADPTFKVISATRIDATVPAGATNGPIRVATPGGVALSTDSFTVGTPPSISGFSPSSGPVGQVVTISGDHFTGATQVAFNGTLASVKSVDSDTQITATVPDGATNGKISVTAPNGTATSTTDFAVTPSITSFDPTHGLAGAFVRITGSAFNGATQVAFNGTPAVFNVETYWLIYAHFPAGATTGKIRVTTPSGAIESGTDFTADVPSSPPLISYFTPNQGPAGTEVAINGSNFSSVSQVTFNGTAASFTIDGDNLMRAVVPSGATKGKIAVTNGIGTTLSTNDFTVTAAPSISAFTPTSGAPGTPVVITGSNFTGASSVTFNGASANFNIDSDSQISTTVPDGATTGKISVTNGVGTGASAADFAVLVPPPTITDFTPKSGPTGTLVTISGTHLNGTSAVSFGGTPASSFGIDSDNQVRATVGSGTASGPITLTTPGGMVTSTIDFTVNTIPIVQTLTLNPTDDACVKDTAPTTNYGSLTTLQLKTSPSTATFYCYLKFNVTGISGTVTSAKLRLFATTAGNNGGSVSTVSNYYLDTSNSWLESGLIWNNKPALGSPLSSLGAVAGSTWYELDVTAGVSGNGTLSFGMNNPAGSSTYYSSKEGANPPQLVITYLQ